MLHRENGGRKAHALGAVARAQQQQVPQRLRKSLTFQGTNQARSIFDFPVQSSFAGDGHLQVYAGGIAKLLNLNRRNVELLVLTKLDTIFEVFDDEMSAVNSFFPGREIKRFDILSFVRNMKSE